jgi:hypothetical protein
MSDTTTDAYKKYVTKLADKWETENEKISKKLTPIEEEIAKLKSLKSPAGDAKKRLEQLYKDRDKLRSAAANGAVNLRLDLLALSPPLQAELKELVKLPAWMEKVIKVKGIPLGKGVSICPNADIDLKQKKLKSLSITITFP